MSNFKPGDRVRSEYMPWKHGVIVLHKSRKFYREGNAGPSTFVEMDDDNGRQVWWSSLDLLPEE